MRILGLLTLAASRELILKFNPTHADCREKSMQEYADETAPLVSEDLGSPVTAEVLNALENIILTVDDLVPQDLFFASVVKRFRCIVYAEAAAKRFVFDDNDCEDNECDDSQY